MGKILVVLKKVWAFLKKWGLQLVNLLVLFVAYDFKSDSLLVGLWLFLVLAYLIFWELFKGKDILKKDE
jgi:hypothetical protein